MREATSVTFVGFSMPITDFAARALFFEGLQREEGAPLVPVTVIDRKEAAEDETLRNRYRFALHRDESDINFDFNGAMNWAAGLRP